MALQVFHLGEGVDSKNWMSHNGGDTGKMYLNHIREVVHFIASQPWGLQVLLWDDMLRKVGVAAIQGQCHPPGHSWAVARVSLPDLAVVFLGTVPAHLGGGEVRGSDWLSCPYVTEGGWASKTFGEAGQGWS